MKVLPLLLWICCTPSWALVLSKDAVQHALDSAEWVGEVAIAERQSYRQGAEIFTRHRAEVERTLYGDRKDTVVFHTLGGEIGELGSLYSGMPRAYQGRRYRIYLKQQDDKWWITGWEAGLVDLDGHRAFTRNRTDGSDGSGNGSFLYWRKDYFPIPYFIARDTFDGDGAVIRDIDRSFFTWREVTGITVDFIPMGCIDQGRNLNDGYNTILMVHDHWPFDASAIAITRNFYIAGDTPDSGLILDSDILLNAEDHTFATDGNGTSHDVRNIVTHEVGHFLGLGHETVPEDTTATMYAQASTGETMKRTLEANDLEGIQSAYAGVVNKPSQWVERFPSCAPRDAASGCLLAKNTRPPNWLSALTLAGIWILCWRLAGFSGGFAVPRPPSSRRNS